MKSKQDLIRKLAWSAHKESGMDWKDLFQEACIAAFEAEKKYEPRRGSASTFLWFCISNHLRNYVRQHTLQHEPMETMEDMSTIKAEAHVEDFFDALTERAKQIVNIILAEPERYDCLSSREAKALAAKTAMTKLGLTWNDVRQGMLDIHKSLI
jgi:RNA polymerase sigma factor (sigma-70 family)